MYIHKQLPNQFSDAMNIRANSMLDTSAQALIGLARSASCNCLRIFWNDLGMPIGYVSWASVDKYTIRQIKQRLGPPKYIHEWQEGWIFLVLDVVLLPQWRPLAKRELVEFLRTQRAVAFIKRDKLRVYVRSKDSYKRMFI